mgnify:CR=1 FL=1
MNSKGPVSARDIIFAEVSTTFKVGEVVSEADERVCTLIDQMIESLRRTHFEDGQPVTDIIWDAPKEGTPIGPNGQIMNIVWDVLNEIRGVDGVSCCGFSGRFDPDNYKPTG